MNLDGFLKSCGDKTIFNKQELADLYKKNKNIVMLELVYNGFFGAENNVIYDNLNKNGLFNCYPYEITYTQDEFKKILKLGGKDDKNIIID